MSEDDTARLHQHRQFLERHSDTLKQELDPRDHTKGPRPIDMVPRVDAAALPDIPVGYDFVHGSDGGDLRAPRQGVGHLVNRSSYNALRRAAEKEIQSLNTKLEARVREINFLQHQVEAGCALNDIKYEQWSHFCEAIPQNITLWVDRCPHCGMPRE